MSHTEREDYDDQPPIKLPPKLIVPQSMRKAGVWLMITWSWYLFSVLFLGVLLCYSSGGDAGLLIVVIFNVLLAMLLLVGSFAVHTGIQFVLMIELLLACLMGLGSAYGTVWGPMTYYDYRTSPQYGDGLHQTYLILIWYGSSFSAVLFVLALISIIKIVAHLKNANPKSSKNNRDSQHVPQ